MRRLAAQIEELSAVRFIVVIGLVGGAVQGVPRFFLTSSRGLALLPFVLIGLTAVLLWTAALVMWWVAVRRRRWSLLATATHITLGLAIADLLTDALSLVISSIESQGVIATALMQQPWTFISSNLLVTAIRCPVWFVAAAVTVAIGRHLSAPSPISARTVG